MKRQIVQTNGINIRMSDQLTAGLDMICEKKGLSRTECIRFLIQNEVEKETGK